MRRKKRRKIQTPSWILENRPRPPKSLFKNSICFRTEYSKPFKKPCRVCGDTFQPSNRGCKVCDDCFREIAFQARLRINAKLKELKKQNGNNKGRLGTAEKKRGDEHKAKSHLGAAIPSTHRTLRQKARRVPGR